MARGRAEAHSRGAETPRTPAPPWSLPVQRCHSDVAPSHTKVPRVPQPRRPIDGAARGSILLPARGEVKATISHQSPPQLPNAADSSYEAFGAPAGTKAIADPLAGDMGRAQEQDHWQARPSPVRATARPPHGLQPGRGWPTPVMLLDTRPLWKCMRIVANGRCDWRCCGKRRRRSAVDCDVSGSRKARR